MSSIARFPKLDECAHFHYEHVELSSLEVSYIQINFKLNSTLSDNLNFYNLKFPFVEIYAMSIRLIDFLK